MYSNNKMKTKSQNTYYIVHHVGKQGMLPPRESNQPGFEKCTTESATSLEKHSDSNQAQGDLPAGLFRVTPTKKKEKDKISKWSRENYKEKIYAFYMFLEKSAGSHTKILLEYEEVVIIMKSDGNKLANIRTDIMNKKRLTNFELREIKEKFIADLKDIDSGNVGIRNGDVDDSDESTGGISYTDVDTRVAMTRNVNKREHVNHIRTLGDIPIDEESEDELN